MFISFATVYFVQSFGLVYNSSFTAMLNVLIYFVNVVLIEFLSPFNEERLL